MDVVKITLQNKELIEELINSSEKLKVDIDKKIIDEIAKRLVTKILNNFNGATKKAFDELEEKISLEFLEKKPDSFNQYRLGEQYRNEIATRIRNAWEDNMRIEVDDVKDTIIAMLTVKLDRMSDDAVKRLERRYSEVYDNIDKKIENAVENYFKKRLA